MPPLIEIKNLSKYFNVPAGKLHAVDNVSFTIEKGKTLGVVGESGCGKSTLGRTIIRLLQATDGLILLDGVDITHVSGKQLKEVRKNLRADVENLGTRLKWINILLMPLIVSVVGIGYALHRQRRMRRR